MKIKKPMKFFVGALGLMSTAVGWFQSIAVAQPHYDDNCVKESGWTSSSQCEIGYVAFTKLVNNSCVYGTYRLQDPYACHQAGYYWKFNPVPPCSDYPNPNQPFVPPNPVTDRACAAK